MAPQLAQVFAGRTQFIRPYAADPRLVAAQPFLGTRPLAWVETPVRDASGSVVAALGFATYVDRDFESILSAARPGETGEAYAFDESGTLLSEIRDVRGLHRAGILPAGTERAAFRLKVRDPGLELDPQRAARRQRERLAADPAGGGGAGRRRLRAGRRAAAGRAARPVPQLPRRRSDRRVALAARRAHGHRRRDRRRRSVRAAALRARDARGDLDAAGAHRGLGRMVDARARAAHRQARGGAAHRRLPARARARRGRHGDRAPRAPRAAQASDRDQDPEAAPGHRRAGRALRARGAARERAATSEHDRDLRLRAHARRTVLLRDGVRRRPDASTSSSRATARSPLGAHAPHRHAGVRGARRGAREGHGPPRHQARERDDLRARRRVRLRQAARLRHRQAHRGRRPPTTPTPSAC